MAIVAESTYPFLKGGVSAVVHDIVTGNQDLTFGILHIAWDSASPQEDLYGMPPNVKWVRPIYLSMQEHLEDFVRVKPGSDGMRAKAIAATVTSIFDAVEAVAAGDNSAMLRLYDDGMNPRTRTFSVWSLLGTKELMAQARERLAGLGLPLVDTFWLLREFFSLSYAILSEDVPMAKVYHAHTTGYAALLGAMAARQNGTKFLLTEHNLYVRDTVNTLLDRSLALSLDQRDWRTMDVSPQQRAWMAWWIEMGKFCYPSAEVITYLYPSAITEAADLGSPVGKAMIVPNGMRIPDFDAAHAQRLAALEEILAGDPTERTWRLAYIARVVPIKGLADLISTLELLVSRGVTNFHLDVLGPTDHTPDYYMLCREKARTLGVEDYLTFRGTLNVRDVLGDFDLLVLPSYNEGQPIVVLEAMTAGVPIVGTNVGGMAQLISDPLTTPGGRTFDACGVLVNPDYVIGMADALQQTIASPRTYADYSANARQRVVNFFQLDDVIGAYNRLYKELGGLPVNELEATPGSVGQRTLIDLTDSPTPARDGGRVRG
ncbi:MAG TPA: GT4 family glycosyltransferase PelF [Acidimicrobiales bacterium]|nr:GT4 family glycosyltransferase PelF [Acidimicrobiales bacterium]